MQLSHRVIEPMRCDWCGCEVVRCDCDVTVMWLCCDRGLTDVIVMRL
jgi:hypothetical protein